MASNLTFPRKPALGEWIQTDASTNQYGRKLSETVFEFKEDGREQERMDITDFTDEEKESAINAFGYTLGPSTDRHTNIIEEYGDNANWIIAECLFELDM